MRPLRTICACNIKRLRKDRRWSQDELAKKALTSITTICSIENGRSTPSLDMIEQLSRALRVPAWELLFALLAHVGRVNAYHEQFKRDIIGTCGDVAKGIAAPGEKVASAKGSKKK